MHWHDKYIDMPKLISCYDWNWQKADIKVSQNSTVFRTNEKTNEFRHQTL